MSLGQDILNAFGSAVGGQLDEAKSEAQTIAAAVAVWGVIIAIELGVLIYFVREKK
jgi:hypothetical protein